MPKMCQNMSYSNLYDSPTVHAIMNKSNDLYGDKNVLILIGIEFSDDFDPNIDRMQIVEYYSR